MRVLITGGAGFIGANLTRRLLAEGHHVTVLDNLVTGRLSNLEGCHVTFLNADVREPIGGDYEWIFNLACPASPPHYQRDPLFTLLTNIEGMKHVLECAKRCGATVIQASTSEVYGDPECHPQAETYWGHVNPLGVRSCYDEGKRIAETLALEYRRMYGVDVRLVRIFNTYGPWMDPKDGRVVSNFILQALNHTPLTLFGKGDQTRSFQYIDDLVEALIRYISISPACITTFFESKGMMPVLNLGNPGEFTVRQLAEMVLELMPTSRSCLTFAPLPGDDPKRRRPDIAWAKGLLDWEPRIQLREGLKKTIAYFASLTDFS